MIRRSKSKIKKNWFTSRIKIFFVIFDLIRRIKNSRIKMNRFGPSPGYILTSFYWNLLYGSGKKSSENLSQRSTFSFCPKIYSNKQCLLLIIYTIPNYLFTYNIFLVKTITSSVYSKSFGLRPSGQSGAGWTLSTSFPFKSAESRSGVDNLYRF